MFESSMDHEVKDRSSGNVFHELSREEMRQITGGNQNERNVHKTVVSMTACGPVTTITPSLSVRTC